MRLFLWTFLLMTCLVSAQPYQKTITLSFEKDLIPEGIAVDSKSGKLFINSLKHNKIVQSNLDGENATSFIQSNEHGYLSGFGMTIKRDILYALGNTLTKENNKSILILLDIISGDLIKSYTLNNSKFIYLNDIAIDHNGKVFISDSESENIYTINESKNSLEVFYSNEAIKHTNGITISNDNRYLYFATYTSGIRILDIASQTLINEPNNHKGIDGMKFYKNSLIAIVNSRRDISENGIYQYYLNDEKTEIITHEKLMDFENPTDIPTTFDLVEDKIYFLSDSQMDMLNQQTNMIIDPSKLKNYKLIVHKL
ncbi:SMP-30/gluconolactonase/LRE family protein [Flagellimonas meridianipacifica]|uniref:SMP-30/gluconolaconase/LRE-like protein n=1 Tax=Flagellimonas meridianipacifica TaxID=1080225 RepID=A0A2T0MHP3_9FLAO|nr:SMP-30/gluconolactonase/LRE family protein [Allomuricauda pacifica]PRX57075.1 SMP-30/gluconolaconase/LRE-like protein [Allomuricauda pacifica]